MCLQFSPFLESTSIRHRVFQLVLGSSADRRCAEYVVNRCLKGSGRRFFGSSADRECLFGQMLSGSFSALAETKIGPRGVWSADACPRSAISYSPGTYINEPDIICQGWVEILDNAKWQRRCHV